MYRMQRRIMLAALSAVALVLTGCGGQQAADGDFPSEDIRLIVPYDAGGSTDTLARAFAPTLKKELGQTVVVENMPGASGTRAVQELLGSKPDGHTVVWGPSGPLAINPTTGDAGYSISDYELVGLATINPYVLVAKDGSKYQSAKQLFDAAGKKPGKITVATPGRNTIQSVLLKAMADNAGVKLTRVPFDSGAESLNAVLGGNVDASFNVLSEATAQIKGGKLVGLGVSSNKANKTLPEVPPLKEQGLEPPAEGGPTGLMLPNDTPKKVVDKWGKALDAGCKAPKVIKQLEKSGVTPTYRPPKEGRKIIKTIADAATKAEE